MSIMSSGIASCLLPCRAPEIHHCVNPEKPEQYGINQADECIAEYWVIIIQGFIDPAAYNCTASGACDKSNRKFKRYISQFLVDGCSHDCFCEDVKNVSADCQDSLYPNCHQCWRDNKTSSSAYTTCDKTGGKTDRDRSEKYQIRVMRRCISLLAAYHVGSPCKSDCQDWQKKNPDDEEFLVVLYNRHRDFIIPLRVGPCSCIEKFIHLSCVAHLVNPPRVSFFQPRDLITYSYHCNITFKKTLQELLLIL